jgi:site-specific DNA-methyltransferase (adenine-specific)
VGSGSECVSAKKNNVNYIGFEINMDYIGIANQRLCEGEETEDGAEDEL